GMARVSHSKTPRSIRNITPDVEALARKGRAYRSIGSLLRRNAEQTVAGAGAYMVAAAVMALAAHRDESFETVLEEMLPEQNVSVPVPAAKPEPASEPAPTPAPAPAAKTAPAAEPTTPAETPKTAPSDDADQNDPQARYTAIVETRFMAGVKEFQQWMGDSHAVTGTGLPKRADIQDVAATIGIEAEGVAKKQEPEAAPASDSDLNVPAEPQPTRYVQSAQAIPELMAFWTALQDVDFVELSSTKIQPGANAQDFGFEEFDQLKAAEALVAAYVHETLTYATDGDAAARTAQYALDGSGEVNPTLIPRLRQLEAMNLVEI